MLGVITTERAVEGLVFSTGIGGGIGFSFLVVRWFANFIAGRLDKKEASVNEGMLGLIKGLQDEIARLGSECSDLRERQNRTEKDLLQCKLQHAETQAELMAIRAKDQGYGTARQEAAVVSAAEKLESRDNG